MSDTIPYNNDMDRRTFIKTAATVSLAPVALADTAPAAQPEPDWSYIVYCFNRKQGEWTFSYVTDGSFAHQREYMTFDEGDPYVGFMDGGKLHFNTFDDASNFVNDHVRTYDDINVIDTIYDVYFKNSEGTEIHVAHYWFNGDTGNQVHWEVDGFNRKTGVGLTDWSKVECS